jgi:hypothetical protein
MDPPLNYGNASTWDGFRSLVLGGQIGGVTSYLTWEELKIFIYSLPQAAAWYMEWLSPAGCAITIIFAAAGLISLATREWRFALCIIPGFLVPIFPTLTMPINDTTHYLLISNWLLFLTAAIGVQTLLVNPIARIGHIPLRRSLALAAYTTVFASPCCLARFNWNNADMHEYNDAEILARGVFNAVRPRAVVFCWWGPTNALRYAQFVEGLRPDVAVYDDSTTLDRGWGGVTPAIGRFFPKRPVYSLPLGDQVATIERKYTLRLVADLGVFGQSLYEVIGSNDVDSTKAR